MARNSSLDDGFMACGLLTKSHEMMPQVREEFTTPPQIFRASHSLAHVAFFLNPESALGFAMKC